MALNPGKLNTFLMFKLPSAWLCGVRVQEIDISRCSVGVRHRWINQNPFNSMYFAVQAMAAELSTGALVMNQIQQSGKKFSMLVLSNNSSFSKKATGKVVFDCTDGAKIGEAVRKSIRTGEGVTFWMKSIGKNEEGMEVSKFNFEWTVKVKEQKKQQI